MPKKPNISLPQGVKDILPEEAAKIDSAECTILAIFRQHGFRRIITPFIEYLDTLSLGLDSGLKDKVFKFIDPHTGKVVAVRPDITPQIARVVATKMFDMTLPLKLCYNESVIRLQDPRNGTYREVLQIGGEYLTRKPSRTADAEIIIVAIEILNALGFKDFKIDIGDVGFIKTIIEGLPLDASELYAIKKTIALKDVSALERILRALGKRIDSRTKRCIMAIPSLFGKDEVLKKAGGMVWQEGARDKIDHLRGVLNIIDNEGLKDYITIDLGELRGFDYYTGIIFEGFAQGIGKAILNGGRYDNLVARYGYNCSATGFAFDLENLITAMEGDL